MQSEVEVISYKEGLRMIIKRWPEIKNKLSHLPIHAYPFPRSLIHIIRGQKKMYSHTPTIRSLNKVIKFMRWDYVIKHRFVNENISQSKGKSLMLICEKFNSIDWSKESDHLLYFFKDTYQKGYISDIYKAPGKKTLNRLLSVI